MQVQVGIDVVLVYNTIAGWFNRLGKLHIINDTDQEKSNSIIFHLTIKRL